MKLTKYKALIRGGLDFCVRGALAHVNEFLPCRNYKKTIQNKNKTNKKKTKHPPPQKKKKKKTLTNLSQSRALSPPPASQHLTDTS